MKLFAGLGNPGLKYARNRHNVGFMALDRIAEIASFGSWRSRFHSLAAEGELGGQRVLLIKPQTYYNETGNAVREAAKFLKINVGNIIVLHDEIDLAPGKLRVKTGGGLAGNNGLRSIQAQLGSSDFVRVRIGVGHPGDKSKVASYVLHDFSKADFEWLDVILASIANSAGRLAAGETEQFQTSIAQAMLAQKANICEPAPDKTDQVVQNSRLGRRAADNTADNPAADRPGTGPTSSALRKPRQSNAAARPCDTSSQLNLAKDGAGKRRKMSRKIKKGVSGEAAIHKVYGQDNTSSSPSRATSAPPDSANGGGAVATSDNPLAERLKLWFSGKTNDN